jgi:Zn-dependent M28 family amino/carboxypeptidase
VRRTLLLVVLVPAVAGATYLWKRAETTAAGAVTRVDAEQATAKPVFDSARAFDHLRQMVQIGPRPAGSAALNQTRSYIKKQIASYGLTVEEQPFSGATPKGPIDMINLIVRLPGKRPDRILITGHYDTKYFANMRFVGASDGASSGAFLIEIARVLKDQPREFTYELVWFDGEEAVIDWDKDKDSTYGSRYYVQAAQKAGTLKTAKAMILIDMIGDRDLQIRRDSNSTPWLNDIVWAAAKRVGHGVAFPDLGTSVEDDHLAFVAAGVPSVDIIDLDYTAWHTADDDLPAVSARSLQIVGDVVLAALPDIEKRLK